MTKPPYKIAYRGAMGDWELSHRRKSLAAAFAAAKRLAKWRGISEVRIIDTRSGRVWPVDEVAAEVEK